MQNRIQQLLKLIVGLLGILALAFLAGCSGGTEVGNPDIPVDDTMSVAEQELETYLIEQYAARVVSSDAYGYEAELVLLEATLTAGMDVVEAIALPAGGETIKLDATAADFSRTNLQELGVDEADLVKTDGTLMYVAGQRRVNIARVVPADAMETVSTIDVDGTIQEFYLLNGLLVVLFVPDDGTGEYRELPGADRAAQIGMPYWIPVEARTGVMLVDISAPSAPDTIKVVVADGRLVSSRLVGGRLHVVQQFLPDLPPLVSYCDGTVEDCDAAIEANRTILTDYGLNDLVPGYELLDSSGSTTGTGRFIAAEDFYAPDDPQGGSIVSVMTLDLDDVDPVPQTVGFVADAHLIYASTESLYLCATLWNDDPMPGWLYDQRLETVIHKFDLTGDAVTHEATGHVQGQVLNQFSLSEYEGTLRIATTTGERWWGNNTLSNHVYCLQTSGGNLEVVGMIEGLAPGENLYSARFIGPRGFLVTFVKVDPLFTLDLSDPTDPRVIGELKVPGYSDYIHIIGENHLLTIGKDTELREGIAWYQGVQLSIFDVSDFADPVLLHNEVIGDRGTGSEALRSHKAFTFWAENDLLAIPIELYEHGGQPHDPWHRGFHTFRGLYVYRATALDGFELLGRMSTSQAGGNSWTRGVFIDNSIYAIKSDAVRSADVDDIENTVNVLALQ